MHFTLGSSKANLRKRGRGDRESMIGIGRMVSSAKNPCCWKTLSSSLVGYGRFASKSNISRSGLRASPMEYLLSLNVKGNNLTIRKDNELFYRLISKK